MFITDEKHNKSPSLANLSCDEKSICIPLPNKICNSVAALYGFDNSTALSEEEQIIHQKLNSSFGA